MVYFYSYAIIKQQLNNSSDNKSFSRTLFTAFFASALSESLALWLYYPFDLIKTRMQTSIEVYKYSNLLDALIKIYTEPRQKHEENLKLVRMRRFYSGMSLYGITFTTFIAIEFSLYESLLQYIENKC